MRITIAVAALLALTGCGDGPTAIVAGEYLTVAEQLTVEPALGAAAAVLDSAAASPEDTVLADLVRVTARLVRLQGRAGSIVLSGLSTGNATDTLRAVALVLVDRTGPTPEHTHVLVAWQGLDTESSTVSRMLAVLAEGGARSTGTFTLEATQTGSIARVVSFAAPEGPSLLLNGQGSITIAGAAFAGSCAGLRQTREFACVTGRERVSGSIPLRERTDTVPPATVSWEPAVVPAFRIETR